MRAEIDRPHVLTDDELLDAVADVYRTEARLAARKAELLAELDALVRHHTNARTAEALEQDEHVLVAEAKRLPFRLFSTVLAYWAQRVDPDGTDDDAEARRGRRRLHLSRTFDGMWMLDGLLDPVSGTAVDNALREVMGDPVEGVAPAQRRADALVELAERAVATPPGARRRAPLVTVLVGYETFAGRVCELADGTVIAPRDVAALLDTAVIERAVFEAPGRVMEISTQRLFTGAIRRALELRDRTCTHTWCDAPADRCDGDHVIPWNVGGPTTQDNGRLLCPFHNHLRQRRAPPTWN